MEESWEKITYDFGELVEKVWLRYEGSILVTCSGKVTQFQSLFLSAADYLLFRFLKMSKKLIIIAGKFKH